MDKRSIFEVGIMLYGVYVFDEFVIQVVSILNIVTGNYTPSKETASGFAIFGIVRLLVAMTLIFQAGKISRFIFQSESKHEVEKY